MSPTSRSLAHLRQQGYLVAVVERFNRFVNVRQDLFGFADLLAVKPGETLAVQVTTGDHLAGRKEKLLANPNVPKCIAAGWAVVCHGWSKRKVKRGGKAYRYELRSLGLTARDYENILAVTDRQNGKIVTNTEDR